MATGRSTGHGAHAARPRRRGALDVAAPYVRAQRGLLGVAAGAAVLEVGCALLEPWPLALAIDHALGNRPFSGPATVLAGLSTQALLVAAGLVLLVLTAVAGLLNLVTDVSAGRAAERMGGAMRQAVFDHSLGLSLRWHDGMRSGEIVNRLVTDVGRVQDAMVATFTGLLPDVLLLGGTVTLLVLVDPLLAGIALAVLPALAWLSARKRRRVREAELVAREANGRLAGVATDLLRNIRAVQAFGRRDRAAGLFGAHNDQVVGAETRAVGTSARWAPMVDAVLAAGAGAVLVIGGLQVLAGRLTTGQLLVATTYLAGLQSPVRGMVRLSSVRAKATASAGRLGDVLGCTDAVPEPEHPRPVPPVTRGLALEGVSFSYGPGRPVLRSFDLQVAAGETVCLFGPSGAGKSTVLALLLRLYDPDRGRVLVDGVDVRQLRTEDLRRAIAFVPQDPWLLDGTVAENIAFGDPGATPEQVRAAGRAALVDEFADGLPQGYDTPLGESGVLLSGGQRRRVALARAAVSDAPVVLLDEPTTSLDAGAARQVVAAVRSATRGRTVLLVTHDPDLAAIADRTVAVTRLGGEGSRPPRRAPAAEEPVAEVLRLPTAPPAGSDRVAAGRR